MKALVTGGAGFIGGHIARDLLKRGYEVTVIDNLKTGTLKNIPKSIEFYKLDVGEDSLEFLYEKDYELIYHFAGQSSVEISYKDPIYDLQTNVSSTLRLLNGFKGRNCHFIYASSMSVYGGNLPMPKKESASRDGSNFYAIGKKASEDYIKLFSENGLHATSLRLFNIYGPGQNLENLNQGMLSIYLAQALNNNHIIVKGSLERSRDFVHIFDVLRFLREIENNEKCFGQEINICSGKEITVRELIDAIQKTLGKESSIKVCSGTPGDIKRMIGDTEKLSKLTGIKTKMDIDKGISTMINALKNDQYYL